MNIPFALRCFCVCVFSILITSHSFCQGFENVTFSQGIFAQIDPVETGNGLSFYDWNKDGWDDLTFCQVNQSPQFFQGSATGFEEVGPFITTSGIMRQICWVDFDNDSDPDLFVVFDEQPWELWENDGDFNFTEISSEAGFPNTMVRNYGFCWGDYDQDSFLDVYVSTYWEPDDPENYAHENHLWRNNGDGTFTDVTVQTGTGNGHTSTLAPIWLDYDNDLDQDLYVVNDKYMPNALYRNNGDGTFSDVSVESHTDVVLDGMSATVGDYSGNGYLDIYMTNTSAGNVLLQNMGDGTFDDFTFEAGVEVFEECWGSAWIDYDLDKDLDLYVTTEGEWDGVFLGHQNYFYEYHGDNNFEEVQDEIGLADDDGQSFCVATGDFDRDGYPDFAITNIEPFFCELWQNTGEGNNYIGFELEGTESNYDGIGAWISISVEGETYRQFTFNAENYMSQNSQRKLFGLGNAEQVDSVTITWPLGLVQTFYNPPINQYHHVKEGLPLPPNITPSNSLICGTDPVILSAGIYEEYLWSNDATTPSITITEPGEYWVTVVDAEGNELESAIFIIEQAPDVSWTFSSTQPLCYGEITGALSFIPGNDLNVAQFTWLDGNQQEISNEYSVASLESGLYSMNLVDQYGCAHSQPVVLPQPDLLEGTPDIEHPDCAGETGSVVITTQGGTGTIDIDWGQLDPDAIPSGDHDVLISDQNGCETTVSFTIQKPAQITAQYEIEPPSCYGYNDGQLWAEFSGGTGELEIDWNGVDTDSLAAGTHEIIVQDSLGCSVVFQLEVSQPQELGGEISIDTVEDGWEITVTAEGGTEPYSFDWSNGDSTATATFQEPGDYWLLITDENGCNWFIEDQLVNLHSTAVIDDILFYPNPSDGLLRVENQFPEKVRLRIYNSLGQPVKELLCDHASSTVDLNHLAAGSYLLEFTFNGVSDRKVLILTR